MKQQVYSKKEVRNMLEFDDFNNVVVYRIMNSETNEQFSPIVFYSKSLAKEWLASFIKCYDLDVNALYISDTTLRFY